jgi:hypothetical protein
MFFELVVSDGTSIENPGSPFSSVEFNESGYYEVLLVAYIGPDLDGVNPNGTLQFFVNATAIDPAEWILLPLSVDTPTTIVLNHVLTIAAGDVLTVRAQFGAVWLWSDTPVTLKINKIGNIP